MNGKTGGGAIVILVLALQWQAVLAAESAQELFSDHRQSVYRIDVVSPGIEKKSSLGTGFVFGRRDVLATNYHVVSRVVHKPEQYRLEWKNEADERGPLTIIAVDVIHDLALVQASQNMGTPFETTLLPDNGTDLFAMGHPLALGLSIVPGTANGLLEKSLYTKVHFSGNLNPGMSGGPTVDTAGRVVGVNVSTAGRAVSFLVPSQYLNELLARTIDTDWTADADLHAAIGRQLLASQESLIAEFTGHDWPTQQVGKFTVPDEISEQIDCWGDTQVEEDDTRYREISTSCSGQDAIFLSERQRAGSVSYEYFWLDTESLSNRAFYNLYRAHHSSAFWTGADETDVGNFTCSTRFVELSGQSFKANICARPYLRYPPLTDFMVLLAMNNHEKEGFMFTMDLSSVTLENGMNLLARFLERFAWQP